MNKRAFTLIELMIVASIISVLASIAIPKFAQLMRKSKEGSTKGNLGAIRSAISIYYGENTFYPSNGSYHESNSSLLENALVPKYLEEIPSVRTGYHADSNTVYAHWTDSAGRITAVHDFTSAWMYASGADSGGSPMTPSGAILVGCTHTDTKSSYWYNY